MNPEKRAGYRLALVLLFIAPALWTVNYLVGRSAPGVIEPNTLALLRWLMASLLFSFGARSELWAHRHQIAADWKHFVVLGALGMWICGAWVYIGARSTGAVNISLIYSVSPVLIAACSAWWLKERFRLVQACGLALALAGVLHVIVKGQWNALQSVEFVAGDGWIVAAALSWTAYSVLLKRWPSPLGPAARLAVISIAGVLVLLPFAVWEGLHNPLPVLTPHGTGLALAAALLPGYGAYLAYSVMQRELGAAKVGVALYLSPIYTAVMAWLFLGEPLLLYHAWGMALILPGIYLVTRESTRR